jgi:hypothetical protein
MKPIAVHLDRLSQALAAKGVAMKRTDLLQVAAAAFGYHSQNEASAASRRGDLSPGIAVPVCRVSVPSTPFEREIVVLETDDQMLYGIDAAFFDAVDDRRAERYGPTPYGTLVDLRNATEEMADLKAEPVSRTATANAHFDRALREARFLREQLDAITGETDQQGQDIGQAENTLSRLISALEGGSFEDDGSRPETAGRPRTTDAERASWGRDVDGMRNAVEDLAARGSELAMVTPDTREWVSDCMTALKAGLRIADDWKRSYEQEVRFGPDWRSWTKDLRKASTRGAKPLSDLDLHRIRHAVADNHSKSSESERSQTRWRVGTIMERHARALLLRLDIAEAQLAGDVPPIRGSAHLRAGSLWRIDVGIDGDGPDDGRTIRSVFYVTSADEDGEQIGRRHAERIAAGRAMHVHATRPAPREEAALRLLDAARQAVAVIPDPCPARRALVGAIAAGDRTLPTVIGNPVAERAPPQPLVPAGADEAAGDRQSWRYDIGRAERLQDALVLAANSYALDRSTAIASLGTTFGFDHERSIRVLDGQDAGVRERSGQ